MAVEFDPEIGCFVGENTRVFAPASLRENGDRYASHLFSFSGVTYYRPSIRDREIHAE